VFSRLLKFLCIFRFSFGDGGTGNFDRHCVFGVTFNLRSSKVYPKGGDVQVTSFLWGCTSRSHVGRSI